MFEAHAKRKAIAQLIEVKNMMIAGVWGNSNYDPQEEGKEGSRTGMLQQIEDGFNRAVVEIRTGVKPEDNEIDWTDPFFAAIKSPRIGTEDAIIAGMMEEAAVRQDRSERLMKDFKKEIDQT
jgi:hypothetical protein